MRLYQNISIVDILSRKILKPTKFSQHICAVGSGTVHPFWKWKIRSNMLYFTFSSTSSLKFGKYQLPACVHHLTIRTQQEKGREEPKKQWKPTKALQRSLLWVQFEAPGCMSVFKVFRRSQVFDDVFQRWVVVTRSPTELSGTVYFLPSAIMDVSLVATTMSRPRVQAL